MKIISNVTNSQGKDIVAFENGLGHMITRVLKKGIAKYNNKHYFIFAEKLVEVPARLLELKSNNSWYGWGGYDNDLQEIAKFYSAEQKEQTIGRPNGNGHMSVYNGTIEVRKDHTAYGAYNINTYLPYALTIGSNVNSEVAKKIRVEVAFVSLQYADLTIGNRKPYFVSKFATSYDTFGLGS